MDLGAGAEMMLFHIIFTARNNALTKTSGAVGFHGSCELARLWGLDAAAAQWTRADGWYDYQCIASEIPIDLCMRAVIEHNRTNVHKGRCDNVEGEQVKVGGQGDRDDPQPKAQGSVPG